MGYRKAKNDSITAVANAIRESLKVSGQLTFPADFVNAIRNGASTNFAVVGGTTQPASPVNNTLWVNTDVPITRWDFSSDEPVKRSNGQVWFDVDVSSRMEFNAIQKNEIRTCPTACHQLIDNQWVSKDAALYTQGQWIRWMLYVYDNGKIHSGTIQSNDGKNAVELNATTIHVHSTGHNTWGYIYFTEPVDLTRYKKLCMVGSMTITGSGENWGSIQFGAFKTIGSSAAAKIEGTKASGTHSIDVSELSGTYYIAFYLKGFANYAMATVSQVYLE